MTTCSNCGVRVEISSDGICPSCRQSAANAPSTMGENPYGPPNESSTPKATLDGMTTGEKVYSAFVIVCIGFLLMSLASFHFLIIPGDDDPGVFYFIVSIVWTAVLALIVTTAVNMYRRSLLVIPTIVQCVVLAIMLYFLPFAIWGGVLLYLRLQREKAERKL